MTPPNLPVLGRTVSGTLDPEQIDVLACLPGVETVTITTKELQARCPVTDQPDIYEASILYAPDGYVLESKALKMYLLRWRDVGISAEDLAATIAQDLTTRLGIPVWCNVIQQVRGGLVIEAGATGTVRTTTEGAKS